MTVKNVRITIRLRWWLRLYLWTRVMLCIALHTRPDIEKMTFWISKGIKVE